MRTLLMLWFRGLVRKGYRALEGYSVAEGEGVGRAGREYSSTRVYTIWKLARSRYRCMQ